jgi:hypothetical protein
VEKIEDFMNFLKKSAEKLKGKLEIDGEEFMRNVKEVIFLIFLL